MRLRALCALAAAATLTACASMNQLRNDVFTYSLWPTGRQPSTYTFERLPSQQVNAQQQQVLEEAAHRAMEGAGFTLAADPATADVSVTLGARVSANERSPYDDPFWWHGGLWRYGYGYGHGYGWRGGYWPAYYRGFGPYAYWPYYYDNQTYAREVAMLIRDRKSGQPLYEVRVTNDGFSSSIDSLLGPMFEAGMKDFPQQPGGPNPRKVVTTVGTS